MWSLFIGAISSLIEWWTGKKKTDAAAAHDAQVRTDQQNLDALQGENDALKQVDAVGAAVDAGGVPIANDPANRNR